MVKKTQLLFQLPPVEPQPTSRTPTGWALEKYVQISQVLENNLKPSWHGFILNRKMIVNICTSSPFAHLIVCIFLYTRQLDNNGSRNHDALWSSCGLVLAFEGTVSTAAVLEGWKNGISKGFCILHTAHGGWKDGIHTRDIHYNSSRKRNIETKIRLGTWNYKLCNTNWHGWTFLFRELKMTLPPKIGGWNWLEICTAKQSNQLSVTT